jgi:hypothetical protein
MERIRSDSPAKESHHAGMKLASGIMDQMRRSKEAQQRLLVARLHQFGSATFLSKPTSPFPERLTLPIVLVAIVVGVAIARYTVLHFFNHAFSHVIFGLANHPASMKRHGLPIRGLDF